MTRPERSQTNRSFRSQWRRCRPIHFLGQDCMANCARDGCWSIDRRDTGRPTGRSYQARHAEMDSRLDWNCPGRYLFHALKNIRIKKSTHKKRKSTRRDCFFPHRVLLTEMLPILCHYPFLTIFRFGAGELFFDPVAEKQCRNCMCRTGRDARRAWSTL